MRSGLSVLLVHCKKQMLGNSLKTDSKTEAKKTKSQLHLVYILQCAVDNCSLQDVHE